MVHMLPVIYMYFVLSRVMRVPGFTDTSNYRRGLGMYSLFFGGQNMAQPGARSLEAYRSIFDLSWIDSVKASLLYSVSDAVFPFQIIWLKRKVYISINGESKLLKRKFIDPFCKSERWNLIVTTCKEVHDF